MSEIRVNNIVSADGANAPSFPQGFSLATGMGITNSPNITGSAVTFSGLSQITDATDSTSTTTGSLVVTGGVGIAKNVYIGAGLSVAGTLTYEDVTSVDSVGMVTAKSGVNVSGGQLQVGVAYSVGAAGVSTGLGFVAGTSGFNGEAGTSNFGALNVGNAGEFKVGTALTMASTSGVATFSNEVWFNNPADGAKYARWRPSQDRFELQDDTTIAFGDAEDLQIYHNGTHSYLKSSTGNLYLTAKSDEDGIIIRPDEGTELYHNNVKRIETTLEGVNVSGMVSATAGLGVTGGMWEGAFIKNERLSQNQTLGISTSNIFVFTNTENATATPNIIWNDSYALSSKMNVGDAVTVTVITTAAAAGYAANWTIDGNAVTEQWNGGSAPSEGGSDGYDIYTLTLVRKAAGTGDTGWLVFANVNNFT